MAASKNPRVRLKHMLFHIRGVEDMLVGVSVETFASVYHIERTVERALQVISEAAKELPPDLRAGHPTVSWSKIIGIGNILRHDYHKVDRLVLWDIVENHLPVLKGVVEEMLLKEFEDA